MSTFRQLLRQCSENRDIHKRLEFFHKDDLTLQLRNFVCDWIDIQPWKGIVDEGQSKPNQLLQNSLFSKFFETVEQQIKLKDPDVIQKFQYEELMTKLKGKYENNPAGFVEMMAKCLSDEKMLLDSFVQSSEKDMCSDEMTRDIAPIKERVVSLQLLVKETESELHQSDELQKDYLFHLDDLKVRQTEVKNLSSSNQRTRSQSRSNSAQVDFDSATKELAKKEADNNKMLQEVYTRRQNLLAGLNALTENIFQVGQDIWRQIKIYREKCYQREMECIKVPEHGIRSLESICQPYGEALKELISLVSASLNFVNNLLINVEGETQTPAEQLQDFAHRLDHLLSKHLDNVLIVRKDAPQIVKLTKNRSPELAMDVTILGGIQLGISPGDQAKINIHREDNIMKAVEIGRNPEAGLPLVGIGKFTNGVATFKKEKDSCLIAKFSKVCLKEVIKMEKGSKSELVTDHKIGIVFTTSVSIGNKKYNLNQISLPIVLTSQSSQEWHAKGTLIWNAAFKAQVQEVYQEEPEVEWSRLKAFLGEFYKAKTGRDLVDTQVFYLARRLFGGTIPESSTDSMKVGKDKFLKEPMTNCNCSFWKWFLACINLVSDKLKQEWNKGLIYGFMSKETAIDCLITQQPGTCLIRFRESQIPVNQSAIVRANPVLSFVERNQKTGEKQVQHVSEVKTGHQCIELHQNGLGPTLQDMETDDYVNRDRKKDLVQYIYLANDTVQTFEEAFEHFLDPTDEEGNSGYIRGRGKIYIPIQSGSGNRQSVASPLSVCSPRTDTTLSSIGSPPLQIHVNSDGSETPVVALPASNLPMEIGVPQSDIDGLFHQLIVGSNAVLDPASNIAVNPNGIGGAEAPLMDLDLNDELAIAANIDISNMQLPTPNLSPVIPSTVAVFNGTHMPVDQ